MATFIKLKSTPIKEIIFTISFTETISDDRLDVFKEHICASTEFKAFDKGFKTQINSQLGITPTANISSDGYILRCSESSKTIQARRGSFSFHKVKEYESFDSLTTELKKYWMMFVESCGPLTVNNVGVRYLNLILKTTNEASNQLVNIKTTHPFGEQVDGFLTQLKLSYKKAPEIKANIIIANSKESKENGVILDIILNRRVENEKNANVLFGLLGEMRDAKNEIFFQTITEATIKKYS
jgi:uncharacterized protein (TIGR04255 family)